MSPCPVPTLWTVEETAAYLQVPVKTLYAWRSRGVGPRGIPVGRYIRYRPQVVEAWLDEQAEAA